MSPLRALLVSIVGLAAALPANAQKRSDGDESLRHRLQPALKRIYERARAPRFLIRREGLPGVRSSNTEAIGYNVEDNLCRVTGTAWTSRGRYSVEYFFEAATLLHVYESFEFFDPAAPRDAWKNFKGIPAWERRIYFEGGRIGYVESSGAGMADLQSAETIQRGALDLREALQRRPPLRRGY